MFVGVTVPKSFHSQTYLLLHSKPMSGLLSYKMKADAFHFCKEHHFIAELFDVLFVLPFLPTVATVNIRQS